MILKSTSNKPSSALFYRFKDPLNNNALRLKRIGDQDWITQDFACSLFRGEVYPSEPIILYGYMGKQKKDFLWTGSVFLKLFSQNVLTLFQINNVTGWKTYPVEVHDRGGNLLPGYHGLSVIGKECRRDRSRSQIITKQAVPGGEPFEVYKGLYFFEEDWDGSDIFLVQNNMIVVTEKVRNLFKKNKVTNVKFIPLEEIELDVYLDKFEKDI